MLFCTPTLAALMALTGACVALDGLTGGVAPTDDGGTPEEAARRSTHRTTPGRKTQLQRRRAVDGDDGTHRLRRVPSKIADVARFPQSRCSVKFPAGRRSTMTYQVPAVSGYVRSACPLVSHEHPTLAPSQVPCRTSMPIPCPDESVAVTVIAVPEARTRR